MVKPNRWQATTAVLLTLGMNTSLVAPIITAVTYSTPASAHPSSFADVPHEHWAVDFVEALAMRNVIAGFPDGTFQPDAPVTRAQYASMLRQAFDKQPTRTAVSFQDIPTGYWAIPAINNAYEMGFLSGYPGNVFQPGQNIPREQVMVSLANGLNYSASKPTNEILSIYNDAASISNFAVAPIAAATERSMVVNYPVPSTLNPNRSATRAEVAALIYQALVSQEQAVGVNSSYIMAPQADTEPVATIQEFSIPAGTKIPVTYGKEKILLMPDETIPVSLSLATNLVTADGKVLIPKGTEVVGELQPAQGGTQFVAQELVFASGGGQVISATSDVITETERVRKNNAVANIAKNAAIGSAAAAAIAGVTGDRRIETQEVLIGTGAGALASLIQRFLGMNHVDLLVVKPETDLELTLDEDLVVILR